MPNTVRCCPLTVKKVIWGYKFSIVKWSNDFFNTFVSSYIIHPVCTQTRGQLDARLFPWWCYKRFLSKRIMSTFFLNPCTNASTYKTGWSMKPNLTPHTYKNLFDKTLNSINIRIFSSLQSHVKKHWFT